MAVGLNFNTKAGLGVTPVLSMPYCCSQIYGISLGGAILLFYLLYILIQVVIRRMKSLRLDLMQLPLSFAFSWLMDFFDWAVAYDNALHSFFLNFAMLLLSVALTGIGASMTLNMRIIPNPADGAMQAVADRTGIETGTAKNIFDFRCIFITIGICLAAGEKITGVNIGTIVCMVGVGRALAVTNHFWQSKMLRAAGMK